MVRRPLLTAILIAITLVSMAAFGQTGAGNSSSTSGSGAMAAQRYRPSQIGMVVPAAPDTTGGIQQNPNGLGWTGGTVGYYGEGIGGGALLSTPTASFDSPQPTVGISNVGRAGISDSAPVNPSVQASLNSSTVVYTNLAPENPVAVNPAGSAVTPERQMNDMGPSFYSDKVGAVGNNGPSLGDIAARYKSIQGAQSVRTYTNGDIRPAGNAPNSGNSVLALNMPPASPQDQAQARATAPVPADQSNSQSGTAQGTQTQSTGNSEPSQPQNSSQSNQLPGTSTILPLLGLLGIVSGGVGLWYRRRR